MDSGNIHRDWAEHDPHLPGPHHDRRADRDIGPQTTLYCPAPLLRAGRNTVTVLELERPGGVLELRDRAELGPPREYVEEFD